MKVKELIKELYELNPEQDIVISYYDGNDTVIAEPSIINMGVKIDPSYRSGYRPYRKTDSLKGVAEVAAIV